MAGCCQWWAPMDHREFVNSTVARDRAFEPVSGRVRSALLEHALSAVKREHPEFSRVEIAGDFRRGCELVSFLAVVAQAKTLSSEHGGSDGLNLIVTDQKHFGVSILNATGSPAHLELLQEFARHKGFDLKPDGLYRESKLVASATEEGIYEALDLQFIEPELREGRKDKAAKHALPKLVRDEDLPRHTSLSYDRIGRHRNARNDGRSDAATRLRVFRVADHSQSAHYAGGLSLEEIAEQHREADRLNEVPRPPRRPGDPPRCRGCCRRSHSPRGPPRRAAASRLERPAAARRARSPRGPTPRASRTRPAAPRRSAASPGR